MARGCEGVLSQWLTSQRGYHPSAGSSKCSLKINLHKAYDSVNWNFIIDCLTILQFPIVFVQWVLACISSPSFSISVNGELAGYFKVLIKGLHEFSSLSGLKPNLTKSQIFTANIPDDIQDGMVASTGFEVGHLPLKYLGLSRSNLFLLYRSNCVFLLVSTISGEKLRNNRIYSSNRVSAEATWKLVEDNVRQRMLSCKFDNSRTSRSIAVDWKLPSSVMASSSQTN
ncbi:uncharacterized protein LOC132316539 [Cornus florida]|uniref:uncharacterized protein LOC132316539 n=1 Tax=Cornus florida TaxID=4283 RepID=UPI00289B1994|nr:uncharacterized protein LOC132316539 [Cornus florida]